MIFLFFGDFAHTSPGDSAYGKMRFDILIYTKKLAVRKKKCTFVAE
jgi:hypothetical protein